MIYVNPMTDIYNSLRTILKDNNIVTAETLEEQQRIAKMVDSIVKVQNELVKQTNTKAFIYRLESRIRILCSDDAFLCQRILPEDHSNHEVVIHLGLSLTKSSINKVRFII